MALRKKVIFYSLDLSNTFNELLYQGVLDGAKEREMDLAVVHGGQLKGPHSFESGRNFLYRLLDLRSFDGLILPNIFSFIPVEQQEETMAGFSGHPLVTIGHSVPGNPSVLVDNKTAFRNLITRLVQVHGVRKFGLITGPRFHHDSIERKAAFLETLDQAGIPWDPEREFEGTWGLTSGVQGARSLLGRWNRDLEALVCFNDTMAIGALQELGLRGLRCPKDLLITGFDNTYESRNTNPPLTTVGFPVYQMGRKAVQTLGALLEGQPAPSVMLESRLFLRRSSGDDAAEFPLLSSSWETPSKPASQTDLEDLFLSQARGLWPPEAAADLRTALEEMSLRLRQSVEHREPDRFVHFCRDLFHRWLQEKRDLEPWSGVLERLLNREFSPEHPEGRLILRQILTESLFILQETESIALTNERIQERIYTTRILDLGEELSAAYTEDQIIQALKLFLPDVGIGRCLLVRLDPKIQPYRPRILMDWKSGTALPRPPQPETPLPSRILTQEFLRDVPHYLMEPLQIRDEFIGCMVVDLPFQPGLLIKNLRFQISTSLIISELIGEIQAHSQTLEEKVTQRTQDLRQANERLRLEMLQRERVESELIRSRNLESLGLLAGGIAHDFNNLLTAIMGNASLMEMGSLEQAEMDHCIKDILNASMRARDLTHQLLTFSKGGSPVKTRTSLALVVEETARFTLRGQAVKPDFSFPPDLWDVEADKGQLSQVVNNMVINAVQAMGGTGRIWFSAGNIRQESETGPMKPGDYVRLSIRDEGPGIPEMVVDRIFDPYFTTKKDGNGLGLATSLGIIKRHGGLITLETGPGKGTTFHITLPRALKAAEDQAQSGDTGRTPSLRILLLEDQETVKAVMVRLLEELGHRVTSAPEGQIAVDLFMSETRSGGKFDLVILDLVVPGGLGGADTLKILRGLEPGLYAIASSGYSEQGGIGNFGHMGFDALLPKPFQLQDIRKALGDFMEGRRRNGPGMLPGPEGK